MSSSTQPIRQSVSLPSRLAGRVKEMARSQKTSANRVLVELIEVGLEAMEAEKLKFFELADQLAVSTDAVEQQRLKQDLARLTFGS